MIALLRPFLLTALAILLASSAAALANDHGADDHGYGKEAQALLAKGEPRAAAIELRNAIKQDPANAAAAFDLAKIDLSLGDPARAEREVRAAQAHGYDAGKALSLLLETYLAEGRYKDLLHDFPSGNASAEIAARIAVGRGRAELGLQQLDRAADDIAAAHGLAPNDLGPLLAEVDLDLARHDLVSARKALVAAESIDPHAQEVLQRQASLLLAGGDAKAAVNVLDTLRTISPGDPAVYLQLANALIAAGNDAKAEIALKTALRMVPGSAEGTYLQALLLTRAGNYQQADPLLQKLSPMMSRIPSAWFLHAIVLEHLGQLAAARDAVQHFLGHSPADPRGERLLAEIVLRMGQPDVALTALGALPAGDRSDANTLNLLARAHAAAGNRPAANKEFNEAIARAPTLEAPHLGLAELDLTDGNVLRAISEYEKALALAPGDSASRQALIAIQIKAGQFREAEANLEILKSSKSASAPAALLTAELQLAKLDVAGAKRTYSGILQDHPHATRALLGLAEVAALEGDARAERNKLDAILALDPQDHAALGLLTTLLESQGKSGEAQNVLEQAHSSAPGDTVITGELARLELATKHPRDVVDLLATENVTADPALLELEVAAKLEVGDKTAAEAALKGLLVRVPDAIGPRLTLARLLVMDKNFDGASGLLEQGLTSTPGNLALLQGLVGVTLSQDGPDAAMAEAKRLATEAKYWPAGRMLPGDFAMSMHKPALAAHAYAEAYAADPSEALVLRLSQALEAQGQTADAANTLRAYLTEHGRALPVLLSLAAIEMGQGELDDAAARLEAVIEADPANAVALNNLAWIRAKQGKPGALDLAKRAYFLAPDPNTADTLGWIITEQTPSAVGVALLRAAHQVAPSDPTIGYHLAAALAATGQDHVAVSMLDPIVASHVPFADRDAANALLHKLEINP